MNKKISALMFMLIVCVGVGCFSLYKLHSENEEIEIAEESAEKYSVYSPSEYFDNGSEYADIYNAFLPCLQKLRDINKDVVGWIYIPETHIDYPLLLGEDNDWYLKHAVDGSYSVAGSVFVDARGFDTNNTVIYAHNMGRRSNIMFHDITNFSDKDWFNKVKSAYIITANGVERLDIFAYSLTKPQTEFYYDDVDIEYIKNNALWYREPPKGEGTVTLSTCAYDYDNARAVLSCRITEVWTKQG